MSASIYHIPLCFMKPHDPRDPEVNDPYPQTAETIAAAKAAQVRERAAIGYAPPDGYALPQPGISDPIALYAPEHPSQEQWYLLDAHEAIWGLIGLHGAQQLYDWTKAGNFVEAPMPLIVILGRYDAARVCRWIYYLGTIAGQQVTR